LGILETRAQEDYRKKVLRGEVTQESTHRDLFAINHATRIEMKPDREVPSGDTGSL